jgi:SOS-response transcriptional repressor LexA
LQICQAFGFTSLNVAKEHLRALATKGAIIIKAGSARGIRLMDYLLQIRDNTTTGAAFSTVIS